MKKTIATALITSFFLNLIWENGQMFLYNGYDGFLSSFLMCLAATLGDVVIITLIYLIMSFVFRGWNWFQYFSKGKLTILLVVSLIFAVIIELYGLGTERWSYNELMPTIPFLDVGFTPILQMIIIVPIVFFLTRLVYNKWY